MAIEDRGSAATSSSIDENRLALLAMALTPNLGPKRIADAVLQLVCPAQLFALTLTELEGLRFPADAARFIFDGKARRAAEEEAEQLTTKGATLIPLASPE
jgi:DNA processing protein